MIKRNSFKPIPSIFSFRCNICLRLHIFSSSKDEHFQKYDVIKTYLKHGINMGKSIFHRRTISWMVKFSFWDIIESQFNPSIIIFFPISVFVGLYKPVDWDFVRRPRLCWCGVCKMRSVCEEF